MANGRIDVYFHNGSGEDISKNSSANPTIPKEAKDEKAKALATLRTIAINVGEQMLNYGISIYGNVTGDYIANQNMQDMISVGSTIAMMTQFPMGTMAGAIRLTTGAITNAINVRHTNQQIDMIKQRTGNSALDNSQETER